jgi:hypothetical protein
VGDRLRNLKNVFKDKDALSRQRKGAEDYLKTLLKPQIAEARAKADKILKKLKSEKAFYARIFANAGRN